MVAHAGLARPELRRELLSGMDNEVVHTPAGAAAKPDHLDIIYVISYVSLYYITKCMGSIILNKLHMSGLKSGSLFTV